MGNVNYSAAYERWRTTAPAYDEYASERAAELAGDGFDGCDERTYEWLCAGAQACEVTALAAASIRDSDDMRREIMDRLRESYVEQCADKYLRDVELEQRQAREDAESDREWEQRYGA